jgi:hypothetical protein
MHAALDINIPNYASAIVTTKEIVASIYSLWTVAAVLYLERKPALVKHIVLFRWTEEASQEAIV